MTAPSPNVSAEEALAGGHTFGCDGKACTCGAFEALYISRSEAAQLTAEAVRAVERRCRDEDHIGQIMQLGEALDLARAAQATESSGPLPDAHHEQERMVSLDEDFEQMRIRLRWPTPNHMRRAADALDTFTPARYGDILRWVADLCDDAPSVRAALAQRDREEEK